MNQGAVRRRSRQWLTVTLAVSTAATAARAEQAPPVDSIVVTRPQDGNGCDGTTSLVDARGSSIPDAGTNVMVPDALSANDSAYVGVPGASSANDSANVGVPGASSANDSANVGVPGASSANDSAYVGVPGASSANDSAYVGVPGGSTNVEARAAVGVGAKIGGASTRPGVTDPLPLRDAPEVSGKAGNDAADAASGTSMGFIGAQTSIWRPWGAGIGNGYDVVLHSESISRRNHFIGRQRMSGAFGGGRAGFEGQLHWAAVLGGGIITSGPSLAYARLGLDWRLAGNPDLRASLLAPLLEVGHFWGRGGFHFDIGARLDTPLLGGFTGSGSNVRYDHRIDYGAYTSVHAGPLLVDFAVHQRHLQNDDGRVTQVEGSLCGGELILACTRVSEYWFSELDQHITQLTLSVGLGYLTHGK